MPIFIQGRIDYLAMSYEIAEANEEHTWQSWMDISSVITFNDEINWRIFGNPRDFENDNIPCIAKNRGFPKNPGGDLARDIENIKSNGSEELFGFTYFLYSEINAFNWNSIINGDDSDWTKLFSLIEVFMSIKSITPDRIRLTTWYNW